MEVGGLPRETDASRGDVLLDIATPSRDLYRAGGKRALDLALGLPLLILVAPVVVVLAVLVGLTSGWPIFYRARRLGRNGIEFRMWKLRTMSRDAEQELLRWRDEGSDIAQEYGLAFKLKDDPRLTRLGRFLRRSSLDELPQVWNVVRGDMTLVGPRPIVIEELAFYGAHAAEILSSRPGLTGLWQVTARNQVDYPERTWMELDSARNLSLGRDIGILLRTLAMPFKFNGL